ncbi:NAD P-binding protein [Gloeophyllum trabeum ATCC 11539]|uniref:NAD P-binding protein n=1 Tax=Gloeophyllum trabeum (strain ATCC 11539 / FP-39264 / Madison 617) TaxID=670483 RepID=S7RNL9_GLOTA|nr:NAD P-binding protein [Gloeophyllum trabeum ATCC 11539]EPQ54364.1 NAD P-binding protein [Gloeophyllum trabeum ATCC 11539]
MSNSKKLILVIGATGAQGLAVIDALLAPSDDGTPSPYAIRALTRNPNNDRARALAGKGVELVQGSVDDFAVVEKALTGVYGAWVNTDGFVITEQKEIYIGMRIFELAKQVKSVRHYVWSNLDYVTKLANYNPDYKCDHYNAKGRVADWMKAQPSVVSDNDMSWSVVTTGPYMEMLNIHMFGPLNKREDGTYVFASPVGNGHVPMIALGDLGWWARYTFDHRAKTSTKDLEIASDIVGWDYLVASFQTVTGNKAIFVKQSLDEWFANLNGIDRPVAREQKVGDGTTTWRQNFSGFWRVWRDDIVKRDMEWIRKVHPGTRSLEKWMKEVRYEGKLRGDLLKDVQDSGGQPFNLERTKGL